MFRDRQEAGEKLALKLKKVINPSINLGQEGFVVVALLRGGIVLGKIVADYFKVPLLPLSVKKIGAPTNPELAIGAVTFDRIHYFDQNLIKYLSVDKEYLKNSLGTKWKEAKILQEKFNSNKITLKAKRVILVDDGIATGTTAICASIYAKKKQAEEIILATPLIAKDSLKSIKRYFDRIVSLKIAGDLTSVSQFYKHFPQVEDKDAIEILNSKIVNCKYTLQTLNLL